MSGEEQFQESVLRHTAHLASLQREIDSFVSHFKESGISLSEIPTTSDNLKKLFQKYTLAAEKYDSFLKGHRTQESVAEQESFLHVLESVRKTVNSFI